MNKFININEFLPTTAKEREILVKDYLDVFGIDYKPQKLTQSPLPTFDKRLQLIKQARNSHKNICAIIFERNCHDDATFRYFGLNTRNALVDSNEWYAECFYNDEIDDLLVHIDYFDVAMLIRTRERDDINKVINEFHKANKPVAFMVDDYCFGDESTPYLFNALNLPANDDFQRSFWTGAARRFENVLIQCDFFVGATEPLCEIVKDKYNIPTISLPSCLNKNQEKISEEVNASLAEVKNDTFTIAYFSGFNSHTKDFLLCKNSIVRFINEYPKAQLLIVGDLEVTQDIVELYYKGKAKFLPVVDYLTLQYLQATSDIVLAPLEVNKFTDCKSPLKIYEAGVVGTPAVASNTKGNTEAIENGKSGFVCKDENEWYDAFCKIYEDRKTHEYAENAKFIANRKYSSATMTNNAEIAFNKIMCNGLRTSTNKPSKMYHSIIDAEPNIEWDDQIKVNIYYGLNKLDSLQPLGTEIIQKNNKQQNYIVKQLSRITPSLKKNGVYGSASIFYRMFMTKFFSRFGYIYQGSFKQKHDIKKDKKNNPEEPVFYDVILINGCDYCLPHPIRYRVDHQKEQLECEGLTCKKIDVWNLKFDDVTSARNFIIFRCPYSEHIGKFVKLAKSLNKKVYFDIDDLVIDTKFTGTIATVQEMDKETRKQYDNGVILYGKALRACGAAITTTTQMAKSLKEYVSEVYINRNVASTSMMGMSINALSEEHSHSDEIRIGYFSGSITHNEDFNLIISTILKLFKSNNKIMLYIVGELKVPPELIEYEERIVALPFVEWPELPKLIANVDINIAPLKNSIFNCAKSENKWVEAALVKVPTVASNIGAFAEQIKNNETGILCSTQEEWLEALELLVNNKTERKRIGENAYLECKTHRLTSNTSHTIARIIKSNQSKNIAFMSMEVDNSGGAMVVKNHAAILQKSGYDVMFLQWRENINKPWITYGDKKFPLLHIYSEKNKGRKFIIKGTIDQSVATFWPTLEYNVCLQNNKIKSYLVQNYEPGFYKYDDLEYIQSTATYNHTEINYLTISLWCKQWLEQNYNHIVKYAPNGIDLSIFTHKKRSFKNRRIQILIEGDCQASHKNVDEAFMITNSLDRNEYSITYLSYGDKKKDWYQIDNYHSNVPHEKVSQIYQSCDILLKTSLLESFSYPPLEMMATGGFVVAIKNEGNVEILKDNYNCLFYEQGNISDAINKIKRIVADKHLRILLEKNGLETVKKRSWKNIKTQVLALYDNWEQ